MNPLALFGPGAESLWSKPKKKTRKTGLSTGSNLPPEILSQLGNAELNYINGNVQAAIDTLSAITRQAPKLAEPYNILGLIYEDSNDYLRALQLYALAATFTPKSAEAWRKVADMAGILGEYNQALAATNRCIKLDSDPDLYCKKVHFLVKLRQIRKARETLRHFLAKYPTHISFMVEFGIEVEKLSLWDTALSSYLRFVFHFLGTDCVDNEQLMLLIGFKCTRRVSSEVIYNLDRIFFAIRKVVDILLQRPDGLQPSVALINIIVAALTAVTGHIPLDSPDMPQFPTDLALLLGICQLRLGTENDVETGLTILNPLLMNIEQDDQSGAAMRDAVGVRRSVNALADSSDSEDEENGVDLHHQRESVSDTSALLLSETSLFLTRQRIRVAEEFVSLGMITRADKQMLALSTKLNAISDAHRAFNYKETLSEIVAKETRHDVTVSVASMWRSLGNVYCLFPNKEEHAYMAYGAALRLNEHDVESLSKYAELTRLNFNHNSAEVFGLLSTHFFAVLHEFESTRVMLESDVVGATAASSKSGTQSVSINNSATSVNNNPSASLPVSESTIATDFTDNNFLDEPMAMDAMESGDDDEGDEGGTEGIQHGVVEEENENVLVTACEGEDDQAISGRITSSSSAKDQESNAYLQQFDRNALQHEIFALIEWTYLFLDCGERDLLSYSSIAVPLIEHWCFTASVANGIVDSTQQRRRSKVKAIVSMKDLATTDSCANYVIKGWLDETQNVCGRFASALCDYIHIEKLLGRQLLLEMAVQATEFMRLIGEGMEREGGAIGAAEVMKKLAEELLHASKLMVLRRSNRESGRKYIGVAERAIPDLDYLSEHSSASDSDSDYVEEEEEGLSVVQQDKETAVENKRKSKFNKMSTSKRRLASSDGKRIRKNARVFHTGVNGGLMFNDFRNAAIKESVDPFIIRTLQFSTVVQNAAARLLHAPGDVFIANQLFRGVVRESSQVESSTTSKYLEFNLPVGRLYDAKQDSVVTCMLQGYQTAADRRNNDTIDRYLDAFCLEPQQPLVILCLASYLVMLSNHSHIKHRHDVLTKGLVLMHRYSEVRKKQSIISVSSFGTHYNSLDFLSVLSLQQETLYNMGRSFHDIRILSLAADHYQQALTLSDQHAVLRESSLNVTREAAHNLVLIYRQSGAVDLALEVMLKYLTVK